MGQKGTYTTWFSGWVSLQSQTVTERWGIRAWFSRIFKFSKLARKWKVNFTVTSVCQSDLCLTVWNHKFCWTKTVNFWRVVWHRQRPTQWSLCKNLMSISDGRLLSSTMMICARFSWGVTPDTTQRLVGVMTLVAWIHAVGLTSRTHEGWRHWREDALNLTGLAPQCNE